MGQKFQTMYKLWGQTTAPEEQTAVITPEGQTTTTFKWPVTSDNW